MQTKDELIAQLKGAMQCYNIIDLKITQPSFEPMIIPALALSDFWAVHPSMNTMFGWAVTHIPSGCCTGDFETMAQALMACGALIASGIPWEIIANNDDLHRITTDLPDAKSVYSRGITAIRATIKGE